MPSPVTPPIPSPYNFVPLSDVVVFPDWAADVSHDVPMKDGLCGHLDVEITAETAIYIRNGGEHSRNRADNLSDSNYTSFFKLPDGRYAIPGASWHGMIRSVVEIITFSKLNCADARYGVRDLNTEDRSLYGGWMTSHASPHKSYPMAGWLSQNPKSREWLLTPCDYVRVERSGLVTYHANVLGTSPALHERQPAQKKYRAWRAKREIGFDFEEDEFNKRLHLHYARAKPSSLSGPESGAPYEGTIVFTGQPARDEPDPRHHIRGNKHLEFIFYNPRENGSKQVPRDVKQDFIFIHRPDDDGKPNDWTYWEAELAAGERVPVFYLAFVGEPAADIGQHGYIPPVAIDEPSATLHSMGLALMYRLAYRYRVHDLLERSADGKHLKNTPDFAETLFGMAGNDNSMKGRVWFETAPETDGKKPSRLPREETVLGSPKPTYFPNYIEQPEPDQFGKVKRENGVPVYRTFMHDGARLRGWKRYPVRPEAGVKRADPGQNKVKTAFQPLAQGASFTGRIHFHNVRPEELGALLWALAWGGRKDHWHSLGMAKPYGYGAVSTEIISPPDIRSNRGDTLTQEDCVREFKKYMENKVTAWETSDPIKNLLAMADSTQRLSADSLKYPVLTTTHPRQNDFADHKAGHYLPDYLSLLEQGRVAALAAPIAPAPTPPSHQSSGGSAIADHFKEGDPVDAEVLPRSEWPSSGRCRLRIDGCGLRPTFSDASDPPDAAPRRRYKCRITAWRKGRYTVAFVRPLTNE